MRWATDTEIECTDCEGYGWQSKRGPVNCLGDCPACDGSGLRAPTTDELDNAAEAAYTRQFEGEPPMSARERDEMQAKRDAQWGVR